MKTKAPSKQPKQVRETESGEVEVPFRLTDEIVHKAQRLVVETVDGGEDDLCCWSSICLNNIELVCIVQNYAREQEAGIGGGDPRALVEMLHDRVIVKLEVGEFDDTIENHRKRPSRRHTIPAQVLEIDDDTPVSTEQILAKSSPTKGKTQEGQNVAMADIQKSLDTLHKRIDGALGVALVDYGSGMALGSSVRSEQASTSK